MAISNSTKTLKGPKGDLSEGDLVVMTRGEQDNTVFPVWGGTQGFIRGILTEIKMAAHSAMVEWENGDSGVYDTLRNDFEKYSGNSLLAQQYHDDIKQRMINRNIQQQGVPPPTQGTTVFYSNGTVSFLDDDSDVAVREQAEREAKLQFFDESQLTPLVIKPEVREDIVFLLKQAKYSKLIFETWGLGKTIEYGKGMGMLFWGPPGTGKTWAASCIAKATGRELLVINAANIQTSEPGGANRNIEQAFTTAREKNNVLFLDECDSLITTRSDVGMILSSEINTLLTQIEKFEGICILATNRIDSLDEALERRLALIIEFPEPDFEAREAIWGTLIPKEMPLGTGVSFGKLAEYKLTGGQIKNVILQAARTAAATESEKVELKHIESAVKRIQKSKGLMGTNRSAMQGGGYKIVRAG